MCESLISSTVIKLFKENIPSLTLTYLFVPIVPISDFALFSIQFINFISFFKKICLLKIFEKSKVKK